MTVGLVIWVGVEGITMVETILGIDVDVGSGAVVGICLAVQEVRISRTMIEMNFFMFIFAQAAVPGGGQVCC